MFFDLQKGGMLKRVSAWILDFIVITIIATGVGSLVSKVIQYDKYLGEYEAIIQSYADNYDVKIEITSEEYEALSDADKAHYEEVSILMEQDEGFLKASEMVMDMTLVIMSLGILFAFLISELVVPLILGNGQTIGKKVFGLAVMQTNQIKIAPIALAVRTILGKCVIETMIPILIAIMIFFNFVGLYGTIALLILLLIQLSVLIYTKTNSAIHDLLASTVVVDMKSQMIFDNIEAKEEYKKKIDEKMCEERVI